MITIGFLLPRSTLYPALIFDLMDGLKAGLQDAGHTNYTITTESIGFGIDPADVYDKAQKLLLQGADVIVAFAGRRLGNELAPLFTAANRLLLVLDVLGEPSGNVVASPTVFYHSLHTSLGCRLAARMAVAEQGETCIVATSFYDAGYPSCQMACQQGLEASKGRIAQYAVTSHLPDQFSLQPIQPTLASAGAQAVVALFCGDLGSLFLRHYGTLTNQVPVYASPFLLEETWLRTTDFVTETIVGCVAWAESLNLPANERFKDSLRQRGRQPTIFSMLAWEGGLTLAEWLKTSQLTDFSRLPTLQFDGPRGPVAFDPGTHSSLGPFYRTTVVADGQGKCRLGELTPLQDVESERQRWLADSPELVLTGWKNLYLCI